MARSRLERKIAKAVIVGNCLALLATGAAFAETGGGSSPNAAMSQQTQYDSKILQKQQEIDRYLFQEHAADLKKKGITVTHTSPNRDYVEIGITPYNDENAAYLYNIFGKDQVKVVEGVQAVTFGSETSAVDAAQPAMAAEPANPTDADASAAAPVPESAKPDSAGPVLAVLAAIVAVAAAAAGYLFRKRRTAKS